MALKQKAWVTKEIMSECLSLFDNKMRKDKGNVVPSLNNAALHSDNLQCTNGKLIFLKDIFELVSKSLIDNICIIFTVFLPSCDFVLRCV